MSLTGTWAAEAAAATGSAAAALALWEAAALLLRGVKCIGGPFRSAVCGARPLTDGIARADKLPVMMG